MPIKVYSKSNCVGCIATVKQLDRLGIEYEVLKVPPHDIPEHLSEYKQLPIVDTGAAHWSGFIPDRIAELV